MALIPYKNGKPIELFFTADVDGLYFKDMQTKEILPTASGNSIPVLKLTNIHGKDLPDDFPYCTIPLKNLDTDEIEYLSVRDLMFIPLTGFPVRAKTVRVNTTETIFNTTGISPIHVNVNSYITFSTENKLKIAMYRNELNSTYGMKGVSHG